MGKGTSSSFWERVVFGGVGVERSFPDVSYVAIQLLVVAVLLLPTSVLAQSGGGGGGGSAEGASAGGSSAGGASGAATGATPSAGSAGADTAAVSGVTGPGNVGGLNNSGNDPIGAGSAAKAPNTPGQFGRDSKFFRINVHRRGCPFGIGNGRNSGKSYRRSDGRPDRRHRHPRTRDAWRRHHSGGIARLKGGSKGQKHLQRMLRSRKTRGQ
jgi:hypothetical protein